MKAETVFASPTPNTEFGSKKNSDDQEKDVRKEEARECTPVSSANPKAWFAPGVAPPPTSAQRGTWQSPRRTCHSENQGFLRGAAAQSCVLEKLPPPPKRWPNAGPRAGTMAHRKAQRLRKPGRVWEEEPCLGASSRSRPEKENERGVEALPAAGRGDHPSAARPPSSGPQRPPKRGPKHWKYRRAPVPFYNFENYVIFI